jgi:predicted dehydrogenase
MSGAHVRRFHQLSSRFSLTACVDVVEERARAAASHLPGAKAATDYRAILDDVDAVLLVLPPHLHHSIATACMEAGKHVLLEKPMANSEQECLDLIATAARGTRLGDSFHAHCTEGMIEAAITEGKRLIHRDGKKKLVLESDPGKHTGNEMAHFLDCIETGQKPLTDGPGSLQGLRIIWRLYDAEQKGVVADLRGLGLDEFKPMPLTSG